MDSDVQILDLLFDNRDGILKDRSVDDFDTEMRNAIFDNGYELDYIPSFNDTVQFDDLFNLLENDNIHCNSYISSEPTTYSQIKNINSDHGYSKPSKHDIVGDVEVTNSFNVAIPQIEDISSISLFSSNNSSPHSDMSERSYSFDENHSPLSEAVELLDLEAFSAELDGSTEDMHMEITKDEMYSNIKDTTSDNSYVWNEIDDSFTQDIEMPDHTVLKIPTLALSDEEKLLLKREGFSLPTHLPLTKTEERALKTVRRKIRNKISAKESRQRKCFYIEGLEKRVEACTKQNFDLQKKVETLEKQNMSLKAKFLKLQSFINNGNKPTQPSTCLMVLMLSLALLVAPNLNMFNDETELQNEKQVIMPGRSRNILQHDLQINEISNDEHVVLPIEFPIESNKSKVVYKSIIDPEIFKRAGELGLMVDDNKRFDKKEQPPDIDHGDKRSMVQSWIKTNFDNTISESSTLYHNNITKSLNNMSSFKEIKYNEGIILDHNYTQVLSN